MNMNIIGVKDAGVLKDERLLLRVRDDTDVGEYFVGNTAYQGEAQVSSRLRHTLWLPDRDVASGDLVVVYTKSGVDKVRENDTGNRTHFFYWGLDSAIWTKSNNAAVLFHIGDWQHKLVAAQ